MIYQGDALAVLKTLPSESVNMCVTSPPYYALRDYGTGHWEGGDENCDHSASITEARFKHPVSEKQLSNKGTGLEKHKKVCPKCGAVYVDGQIGLEETPEEYIANLVAVFHEVKRVLKDDGTLWVNIGDSYNGNKKGNTEIVKHKCVAEDSNFQKKLWSGAKPKDLIGIPWMLAFALRADGWYLRQDIIWQKPNPMPESVTDRCTKSHEYIFLLSKSPRYYFDHEVIQEEAKMESVARYNYEFNTGAKEQAGGGRPNGAANTKGMKNLQYKGQTNHTMHERRAMGLPDEVYPVRNKRDVWSVTVNSFSGAHFATFPEKLIEPCILAGCPKGGVVLDCFNGSGTTGVVCAKNERDYIGIELNPEYVKMSEERIGEVVETIEAMKAQCSLW